MDFGKVTNPFYLNDCGDNDMKVYFGQIYIQAGISFPFSYVFQNFLGTKVTELIKPSSKFIKRYAEDYSLIFRISAKKELTANEIRGATVYKKDKDVEFSIFLPYTPIIQNEDPNREALKYLFDGIYEVLEKYEINISMLKSEQDKIIDKIMSSPEMFTMKINGEL
jgi:hypothetical protein